MALSGCGEARITVGVGTHRFAVPQEQRRDSPAGSLIVALPAQRGDTSITVSVEDAAEFCSSHPSVTDAVRAVCDGPVVVRASSSAYRESEIEKVAIEGSSSQYAFWLKSSATRPRTFLSTCSHWPGQEAICEPLVRSGDLVLSFSLPAARIAHLPAHLDRIEAQLRVWEAAAQH